MYARRMTTRIPYSPLAKTLSRGFVVASENSLSRVNFPAL
jgi:hypothetical protein